MLKNILLFILIPLTNSLKAERLIYDDPFSGSFYEEDYCNSTDAITNMPAPTTAPAEPPQPVSATKPQLIKPPPMIFHPFTNNNAPSQEALFSDADDSYQAIAKEAQMLLRIPTNLHIIIHKDLEGSASETIIGSRGVVINQAYYDKLTYGERRLNVFCALNEYYYCYANQTFLQRIGLFAHHVPATEAIHYEAIKVSGCHICTKDALLHAEKNNHREYQNLNIQELWALHALFLDQNALCTYHKNSLI